MTIFGIFDFLIGGGLIAGLIAAAIAAARLRRAGVAVGEDGGPAAARCVHRRAGAVAVLGAFGAALTLLVLFNVVYFNGFGTDPAIGSPAPAQVTGT